MGERVAGASQASVMAARLAAFVAAEEGLPAGAVRAEALRRLAGGASREIWAVDVAIERVSGAVETLPLVLRKDPSGRVGDGGDRGTEFRVLRAAGAGGVAVPRVYWACDDASVLGSPFFLMDRVEGETLPRRLLREERYAAARAALPDALGTQLARIHALDLAQPDLAGLAHPPAGRSPARVEVERVAQGLRELAVEPHPVLDLAERWLLERAPGLVGAGSAGCAMNAGSAGSAMDAGSAGSAMDAGSAGSARGAGSAPRLTLVHGDYRIGNVVFDETGLRAILDWELVHVGDPLEDLGWLCTRAWRFGAPLPAGGVGTREQVIAAYERAGGTRVDPEALRFWEAFGSFKLALVFVMQARVHLDGRVRSVELASLGRRTVEAEDELLRFLREMP